MYFAGFADEAAKDIDGQIKATKELGWKFIEARNVNGVNINNLPEEDFYKVVGRLEDSEIKVNCLSSVIANWSRQITEPFDITIKEVESAIKRMSRLGTKMIRIMSYAIIPTREPYDQIEEERIRRLRIITKMFKDAGITAVHENCMNYGGMSYQNTLRLIENIPDMKLVFDTGNPVFTYDYSKPKPYPKQSSWQFYQKIKEHIYYIHIKDCKYKSENEKSIFPNCCFCFPGEGDGDVRRILTDLVSNGYDGGVSIEPHLSVVFHDSSLQSVDEIMYANYIQYGRRLMKMVNEIKNEFSSKSLGKPKIKEILEKPNFKKTVIPIINPDAH